MSPRNNTKLEELANLNLADSTTDSDSNGDTDSPDATENPSPVSTVGSANVANPIENPTPGDVTQGKIGNVNGNSQEAVKHKTMAQIRQEMVAAERKLAEQALARAARLMEKVPLDELFDKVIDLINDAIKDGTLVIPNKIPEGKEHPFTIVYLPATKSVMVGTNADATVTHVPGNTEPRERMDWSTLKLYGKSIKELGLLRGEKSLDAAKMAEWIANNAPKGKVGTELSKNFLLCKDSETRLTFLKENGFNPT